MAGGPAGVPDAPQLTSRELADGLWLAAVMQGAVPNFGQRDDQVTRELERDLSAVEPALTPESTEPDTVFPPPDPGVESESPDEGGARHDVVLKDAEPDDEMSTEAGEDEAPSPAPWVPIAFAPSSRGQWQVSDAGIATLPDAAEFVRSLRPLKRLVKSRRPDDLELDEDRTAEEAAETGRWWPVTRQKRRKWLDLTLVIDAAPSLALWKPTVNAFISLLERLGAFRSIQVRMLDTGKAGQAEDGTVIEPELHGGTLETPARGAAEVLDSSGRRLMLVVTDGVSDAWRNDLVSPILADWARAMPVAVLHLLPQRLWPRGGLDVHRAVLATSGPLRANRHYGLELPDNWVDPDRSAELVAGSVPVPVLEFKPRWLHWWVGLVTGSGEERRTAKVLLARNRPVPLRETELEREETFDPSPRDQVKRFHSQASPPAYRLATLLAAVPVTVGVARTLQAELVPDSEPAHLAEVFTSGLLEQTGGEGPWDAVNWDFPHQVRAVLLSGARRSETVRAVLAARRSFGVRSGFLARLRDALEDPDSTSDPAPEPGTADEVALERAVMAALSGPYLSRAARLDAIEAEAGAEQQGPTRVSTLDSNIEPVSDTMSQAPDRIAGLPSDPAALAPTNSPVPDGRPDSGEGGTVSPARAVSSVASTARHERPSSDENPPVWGKIPAKNLNFTGRDDLLDQLGERLGAGTTAVLPAALHGMGGIGKTQMAVEFIYRHLQDYDLVWWIQATEETQIRSSLTELAQHLRLPGCDEAITAVPAVREALRLGRPYRRWLLVFDSAENPDMARRFFPVNGPGEILVTSRNPDWAGIARPLEVAVFERSESRDLLRRRGPAISDSDADLLSEKLGDLPLAIAQAAAWRAETGMPVQEYLRLFDEKVTEVLSTSAPADYEVSVAAAWNVSFDELSRRNPAAHQLLQVCAFFAPEPIARSLFTGVRGVEITAELDEALRDPMELGRAIRDINKFGLAKIDHGNDTIVLHRLVQLVLRNRLSRQDRAHMRHGAHMLLANLDPRDPASPKHWPRYQILLPHVYSAELIGCDDRWVRQLVINLLKFLYHWGDHEGALALADQTVRAWSVPDADADVRPETDLQVLQASERLGFYYWVVGRYTEAAEVTQRTLDLYLETLGADAEQTINAELTVALVLKANGDFAAARSLGDRTYVKTRGLFGEDDPITLNAAHDFVVSLLLTGEYEEARRLAQETYDRRAQILGYDHDATISTQVLLVIARRELGEYPWARIEQERIAERALKLYGENSVGTLRRRYHQAVACRKDGDHEAALALSDAALKRFRERYGDKHPNALACALGHSIDLRHAKDFTKARALGEQVFNLYRESVGEQHPHTLSAALDLGVTMRLSGDPASARAIDERSLEQLRTLLGADHPHSIVCAIDVASDLFALGRVEEAAAIDDEMLTRARRILGKDHPTTLAAQLNRSLDLRAQGDDGEADVLYQDVMERYRAVLGETHPGTLSASRGVRADCDIDPMPL
ncbi:FxSxx-COOH system tetratricopeptide repeat protein [Amycolatopsis sp. NBC_00348]|uniref:FxSxx-COOH system tetratricopeptide repeat protein n=1 Tax=Amycolatopsis sp. NBC_00348 TaxID=2975956 RepID=UPI002E26AAD6